MSEALRVPEPRFCWTNNWIWQSSPWKAERSWNTVPEYIPRIQSRMHPGLEQEVSSSQGLGIPLQPPVPALDPRSHLLLWPSVPRESPPFSWNSWILSPVGDSGWNSSWEGAQPSPSSLSGSTLGSNTCSLFRNFSRSADTDCNTGTPLEQEFPPGSGIPNLSQECGSEIPTWIGNSQPGSGIPHPPHCGTPHPTW